MGKTITKKSKIIYSVLLIILVVLLVSSTFLFIALWEKGRGVFPSHSEADEVVTIDGVDYRLNENVQSILLIGLDKFDADRGDAGYYNDQQADFLMLFVLDTENHSYSAIHLNRDTMSEINALGVAGEKLYTIEGQLALAHTFGNGDEVSCRNTADAVSGLLNNINLDKYISVTMDAVPVITDLVGGVEVEIKDDFSEVDPSLEVGKSVVLNGQQALTFVRTRYGLEDSSNATRMQRQQEYLTSLFKTFNDKADAEDDFISEASIKLSDYIVSNYSIQQLSNLINNIAEYEFKDIRELDGEYKVGDEFLEFYASEESVNDVLIDLFYVSDNQD